MDFDPQHVPSDAGIEMGSSNSDVASAIPLDSAQGQNPSTHHSHSGSEYGSGGDGSGMEPTTLGSLGPELNSVIEPNLIPALGPDLPGPESNAVPPHLEYDSGCGQNFAPGSCGSSVPADPTSPVATPTISTATTDTDEPSVASADSAMMRRGVVIDSGGDSDACTGDCLDSKSPKPEISDFDVISANGPEQMPHPAATPVDTETEPSSDDNSARDGERSHPPIDGTDSGTSGMRGDSDVTTSTATNSIGTVQSSEDRSAGTHTAATRPGDTKASGGPPQDQINSAAGPIHIPVYNDSMEMNEDPGHASLGAKQPHPQTQLPRNGSLPAKNADQVGNGGGGGATPSEGSGATDVDRSDAGSGVSGGGNKTAGLENMNGNRTEGIVGGGAGFGVNGGQVQNQTEHRNGNGNGTGLGNYGLPAQQREKSVFLRLSNNIEDLQTNMTLFSDFLDQISSRLACDLLIL